MTPEELDRWLDAADFPADERERLRAQAVLESRPAPARRDIAGARLVSRHPRLAWWMSHLPIIGPAVQAAAEVEYRVTARNHLDDEAPRGVP